MPVFNRHDRMLRCLDAVFALDYPSFDVLVLDNGSTDGGPDAFRASALEAGASLEVMVVEGRVGRVRNAGVRAARGELIAFTDSDCIPTRGWLRAAVAPFTDPRVGVVTGPTMPEDPRPLAGWEATQVIEGQSWRFETCNAVYRRQALLETDGFDESVSMWEDTAAGWSVMAGGWRAQFVPDALVHHDVTYPGWRWHVKRVARYGEGAGVVKRNPEIASTLMWHNYFLSERTARICAFLLGVALAPVSRKALVLTLPYVSLRLPRGFYIGVVRDTGRAVVIDGAIVAGTVSGSIRARRVLL